MIHRSMAAWGFRMAGPILLGAGLSGCTVFGMGSSSEGVTLPLEVPDAPPRTVAELPVELPPRERPPATSATPEHRPAADVEAETAPVRSPPTPIAAAPPVDAPVAIPPPPPQLTPAAEVDVDADAVRRSLTSTSTILETIDRTALGAAARAQHDTARRFHSQARAAFEVGNVMFAHYLAEKAEALARDLQAR